MEIEENVLPKVNSSYSWESIKIKISNGKKQVCRLIIDRVTASNGKIIY